MRIRVFGQQKDEHGGTYHLESPVIDVERKEVTVEAAQMIAERWRKRWKRDAAAVDIPSELVVDVALCEVDVAGLASEVIVQTKRFVL